MGALIVICTNRLLTVSEVKLIGDKAGHFDSQSCIRSFKCLKLFSFSILISLFLRIMKCFKNSKKLYKKAIFIPDSMVLKENEYAEGD